MQTYFKTALLVSIAGLCGLCAGQLQADEFTSQGAHQHGVATLTLAQEGQALDVMLDSPLVNLVGFEHAPTNLSEQQLLNDTATWLRSGGWLWLPAVAGCKLSETELTGLPALDEALPLTSDAAAQAPDHKHQHDHQHKHQHDDKHKHDHKHDHKQEVQPAQSSAEAKSHEHADLQLTQRFICQTPAALEQIGVQLFSRAVALETVNTQFVHAGGQGAVTLSAESTRLRWQGQ